VQEEEPKQFFTEIDRLISMGINQADINKLKGAGLCTILGILMTTRKEITSIKGLSDAKVDKIYEAAMKIEQAGFLNGMELYTRR